MEPKTYLAGVAEAGTHRSNRWRERLEGLAVLGVTFESGHVLALRQFEHANTGPAFTAVWMREPNGDWRFFSTNAPERSCARYMLPEVADQAQIDLDWIDAKTLSVTVPAIRLRWFVEFEETRPTRFLSAILRHTPAGVLRTEPGSRMAARFARAVLRPGRLRLSGEVPSGQAFRGIPSAVWRVKRSHASAGSYDFGDVVQPGRQESFGDFWVPAMPLAMAGMVEFSPLPALVAPSGRMAAAA